MWSNENDDDESLLDDPQDLCSLIRCLFSRCLALCLLATILHHSYTTSSLFNATRSSNCFFQSLVVGEKPIKFALLFTFGNILAIGSTSFLMGPAEQVRMMFHPIRVYATGIYIASVVLALICALLIHSKILTFLAIVGEICALFWYSLSYIPFTRRIVSDLTIRLFDTEF